ncbi:MAG TPA: cyanophycin synthetase, partial [Kineosporiaceae bacterium]|nr:cyanophycin synthetase [Kineosporiaceae bacterium]
AHHPTEVAAVLRAARGVAGAGRVMAVFQPHLYSRTRIFAGDFAAALGLADEVVVLDVYAAREDPEAGVTGALIADRVPLPAERVVFVPSWSRAAGEVAARSRPGDLVLTIGAGDVTMLGPELLELLAGRS